MRSSALAVSCLLCLVGCPGASDPPAQTKPEEVAMGKAELSLASSGFKNQGVIPQQYTGDGADQSPPLAWSEVPEGTRQFALIVDDPDAPRAEPWVHWVIYNLPGELRELPAGIPKDSELTQSAGAAQGRNSWPDGIGYGGPAPPKGHGPHRYFFRLYALDEALDLPAGLDKPKLLEAMDGHVLGTGQLMGTYERK